MKLFQNLKYFDALKWGSICALSSLVAYLAIETIPLRFIIGIGTLIMILLLARIAYQH